MRNQSRNAFKFLADLGKEIIKVNAMFTKILLGAPGDRPVFGEHDPSRKQLRPCEAV